MPDETTSVDTPAPVPVDPAVVEPVVVATQTEPTAEPATEPSIVAEQSVVAETPVATELAPAVDAIAESTVAEPVTAVEQPSPITQEPAVPQRGDLALTPQLLVNEALTSESTTEKQPAEQHSAPVVFATESAREPVMDSVPPKSIARELLTKARNSIQFRKRKKLDRIIGLFAKQASITNDDVEKLLHISDATASRYLGILKKEGKIKRVGTAGRWVSYMKA